MPAEKTVIETQPQTPEVAEKLHVETDKLRAEIETIEAERAFAAAKHEIELTIGQASVRASQAQARLAELALADAERSEQVELMKDGYHKTFSFNYEIDHDSVRACILRLSEWTRSTPPGQSCDITIIFDSPGGNAIDGLHLWDYIQFVRSQGHRVTTIAMGAAASMAGVLLQAGDVRKMGRESYVMIHEVSAGAIGKLSAIDDMAAFLKAMQGRITNIFAERATDALIARGATKDRARILTERRKFFEAGFKRKDWWLDSDECLREGIVDELI
jgi:Clp protease